jgi:uncharacterized tellurite resistance protein B-like protein
MANERFMMTLGKVIAAVAWADGKVTHDEVNSLKDLMLVLPDMNADDWAELEIYLETPVNDAERARLIEDLQRETRSSEQRAQVIKALKELVNADGGVSEDEKRALREISEALESGAGLAGGLKRLVSGALGRRSVAARNAPNREELFEDYIKNKVYYDVRRRLDAGETDLDIPDDKLRKLSLAGGMMAQIARLNNGVDEAEFNTIVAILQRDWDLSKPEAMFVAQVAVAEHVANMDPFRLRRSFLEAYTVQEHERFLDVLFDIAAADGMVTVDEIEEIRLIAKGLLLSHRQFITAKLKIPAENREA